MSFERQKSDRQPPQTSRGRQPSAEKGPAAQPGSASSSAGNRPGESSRVQQRPGEPAPHRSTILRLNPSEGRDRPSSSGAQGGDQEGHPRSRSTKDAPPAERSGRRPGVPGDETAKRSGSASRPVQAAPLPRKPPPQRPHPRATQPEAAAEDAAFFGPGMSVGKPEAPTAAAVPTAARREMRAAEPQKSSEAEQSLRAEVELLKRKNRKLADQVADLEKLLREAAVPPPATGGRGSTQDDATAALSRRMQLLKAQNMQLERHASALEEELARSGELMAEAEACMHGSLEFLRDGLRIGSQGGAQEAQKQQHWADFERWARQMLQRLKRCQVQAKVAIHDDPQETDPGFIAVGGNRFLQLRSGPAQHASPPPPSLGIRELLKGEVVSLLLEDPSEVHALEARLCELAGKLGSLAVSMRASVMPAMRFLDDKLGAGIQVKVAEAASVAAAGAQDLAELAVLVPSRGTLGSKHIAARGGSKARVVSEVEESRCWGALLDTAPELDVHGDNLSGAQFALPDAEEVLAAVSTSGKGQQVLKQLMERVANREKLHQMRQLLLESELHSLAAIQAAQAEHWNGLRDAVQDSVDLWQGDVEDASGRARDSVKTILRAADELLHDPSESGLKKMVNLLAIHMPILSTVPGLLQAPYSLPQPEDDARSALRTLETSFIDAWESICKEQDARREEMISEMQEALRGIPKQGPWDTEAMHPKNRLQAEQRAWATSLRDEPDKVRTPVRLAREDLDYQQQPDVAPQRMRSPQRTPTSAARDDGSAINRPSSSSRKSSSRKQIPLDDRPAFDLGFLTEQQAQEDDEAALRAHEEARQQRKGRNRLEDRPPFQLGDD